MGKDEYLVAETDKYSIYSPLNMFGLRKIKIREGPDNTIVAKH